MSFRKIFSISSKCKLKLLTVGVTLKGEKIVKRVFVTKR